MISGSFTHSFFIYKWPKNIVSHDLNVCIRNFLSTRSIFERKLVTVLWHKVCKPISEGGLCIKDLPISNLAFLKKMTWDIYTRNNWSTNFIQRRFLLNRLTVKKPSFGSSIWPNFKILLDDILDESKWIPGINSSLDF